MCLHEPPAVSGAARRMGKYALVEVAAFVGSVNAIRWVCQHEWISLCKYRLRIAKHTLHLVTHSCDMFLSLTGCQGSHGSTCECNDCPVASNGIECFREGGVHAIIGFDPFFRFNALTTCTLFMRHCVLSICGSRLLYTHD